MTYDADRWLTWLADLPDADLAVLVACGPPVVNPGILHDTARGRAEAAAMNRLLVECFQDADAEAGRRGLDREAVERLLAQQAEADPEALKARIHLLLQDFKAAVQSARTCKRPNNPGPRPQ